MDIYTVLKFHMNWCKLFWVIARKLLSYGRMEKLITIRLPPIFGGALIKYETCDDYACMCRNPILYVQIN